MASDVAEWHGNESLRMDGVCRLDEEFASILAARVKGRFFKGLGTKGREEKCIL